jgi:hypothetical protein
MTRPHLSPCSRHAGLAVDVSEREALKALLLDGQHELGVAWRRAQGWVCPCQHQLEHTPAFGMGMRPINQQAACQNDNSHPVSNSDLL